MNSYSPVNGLPPLPNGQSYFNPSRGPLQVVDDTVDLPELERSVPRNQAQAQVKAILTNPFVFELIANANREIFDGNGRPQYVPGTRQGLSVRDFQVAAAQAGNREVLGFDDLEALFQKRLREISAGAQVAQSQPSTNMSNPYNRLTINIA